MNKSVPVILQPPRYTTYGKQALQVMPNTFKSADFIGMRAALIDSFYIDFESGQTIYNSISGDKD